MAAKELLDSLHVPCMEYLLDKSDANTLLLALETDTKKKGTPYIYIGEDYIGGLNELKRLCAD